MTNPFDGSLITADGVAKLDAGGGPLEPGSALFFRRQLEFIYPELYQQRYPALNGLRLFNVDSSAPAGDVAHTFRIYESNGVAEFISDYTSDAPPADVSAKEQTFPIRDIAASYSYSFREIGAAKTKNMPLDSMKAQAAKRAIEDLHNRICWYGDEERGLQGVLNYEYAPTTHLPLPIDSSSTGQQIVAMLNQFIYGIKVRTNGREGQAKSLVLCLPIAEETYIKSARMETGTDTTIADFLLSKNSSLARIEGIHELSNDDQDPFKTEIFSRASFGGEDRFAFLYDPRPEVISYSMPTPFTQLPSEPRAYTMLTNCHSSSGGIKMVHPLATIRASLERPNLV